MLEVAESIARTDTGRHRSGNEDAAFVQAPLFVLADGMGGAQAGEVASRLTVEQFMRGLPERGTVAERLVAVAQRANSAIYRSSISDPQNAGMGTTLTAAYVDGETVVIAHVGDSRAYMVRDGELRRLTEDHSLVGELVRGGRLTEEQARVHPQRSVITRALGIEKLVKVDTWTYALNDGDVLLLCSDGLTDMIAEAEVQRAMNTSQSLDAMASALIEAANAAGGRDNITVVLFRIGVGDGSGATDQDTRIWRLGADFDWPPSSDANSEASVPSAAIGAAAPIGDDGDAITPHDGQLSGDAGPTSSPVEEPAGSSAPPPVGPPASPPATAGAAAASPAVEDVVVRDRKSNSSARRERRSRRGQTRARSHPKLWTATKVVGRLVALCVVLVAIGAGAYVASRQYYFVGTNEQGVVVVYRGVPYSLPFGVKMYQTYYESGAPAQTIPSARRAAILNQSLRSRKGALGLVHDVELGEIAG